MKDINITNHICNIYFLHIYNMKKTNLVELIDEIEDVEQIIITTPKYRRCCFNLLEITKVFAKYFKSKSK